MANEEQGKLWNGSAGAAWVDAQASLDRLFLPFERRLVAAASAENPTRVLDVGCGTGATTLAIARALGDRARCTGADISAPMIQLARRRAQPHVDGVEFMVADAQTENFAPQSFDMIVSRFGVMFFDDPVRAFTNLRAAARPGAALRCQVFRSAAENPFMTAAERAAGPLLPELPPRRLVGGPGQFAFADALEVRRILGAAGWQQVGIEPLDVTCAMPESELEGYLSRLGPVGIALRGTDEATRLRVLAVVRAAFTPYLRGGEVRFNAACWDLAARA